MRFDCHTPIAFLLGAFLFLPLPIAAAAGPITDFTSEKVDDLGYAVSVATDAQGTVHAAYVDFQTDQLKYARKIDGLWSLETVDSLTSAGEYTAIAVDALGNPHVAYLDVGNLDLEYATKSGGTWSLETIQSANDIGLPASIALDSQGRPHVAYAEGAVAPQLKYGVKDSGLWTLEVVDASGATGFWATLALDGLDDPHIAYADFDFGTGDLDLRYASRITGVWNIETPDSAGFVGEYSSLALDALDRPHIAYRANGDLVYSRKLGDWTTYPVAESVTGVLGTSLALDAEGVPTINYYDATADELIHATQIRGEWAQTTVAFGQCQPSMTLDGDGNARIVYFYPSSGTLRYADNFVRVTAPVGGERWTAGSRQIVRWDGVGDVDISISSDGGATYLPLVPRASGGTATINVPDWTTENARVRVALYFDDDVISDSPGTFTVAPDLVSPWWHEIAGPSGAFVRSMALGEQGNPHVAYLEGTDLRYAVRQDGSWSVSTVDSNVYTFSEVSLQLADDGEPRVTYFEDGTSYLKYAERNAGTWSTEIVDSSSTWMGSCSLVLDQDGDPHIAYQDFDNSALRYAERQGGVWTVQTADVTGLPGAYASLELDSRGQPHIAHRESSFGPLLYTVRTFWGWSTETVDTPAQALYVSMTLDGQDRPHISYHEGNTLTLRYAIKDESWTIETIDEIDETTATAIDLDAAGNPHIVYSSGDLRYAYRAAGTWAIETIDPVGDIRWYTNLALDDHGRARVTYYDWVSSRPRYASAAVEIASPAAGDILPVGAARMVRWDGPGSVDLSASVDGGNTWQLQATGLTGGEYRWLVPHTPSRFARVRVERAIPHSESTTNGLLTIETSIALLGFAASPPAQSVGSAGAWLEWSSDPGPEDLAGYKLERAGAGASWSTIVPLTSETSYLDVDGGAGSQYRLSAVNGFGEEYLLGEARLGSIAPITAGPLPYRNGNLAISFATASGLGGGAGFSKVALYDVAGRLVRTVAQGRFRAGRETVTWDGRNERGQPVPSGVYFLRAETTGHVSTQKVTVLR